MCAGRRRKEEICLSRLDIKSPSRAQTVVDNLYRDVERRIAASPPGLCPVDMSLSFLQLCHAQSCGKCVPCRIGLGQLSKLITTVLDGTADMDTLAIIEKTARSVVNTADCAIGRDAARLVLDALGKTPLLTAGLHLGEGTGAVASIPLWDMALAVYDGCYSFAEGGIAPYMPQC